MVRTVRTPTLARNVFNHHELSGWQEGVAQYEPRERRRKPHKRRDDAAEFDLPPVIAPKLFSGGARCC